MTDIRRYGKRENIKITNHARLRLRERVKTHNFRNWEQLVKKARYEGKSFYNMSDEDYDWCQTHIKNLTNSSYVSIYNGFVYIFGGNNHHARTLITVLNRNSSEEIDIDII